MCKTLNVYNIYRRGDKWPHCFEGMLRDAKACEPSEIVMEGDVDVAVLVPHQPLIPQHVNSSQSVFELSPFGSPITCMQTNTVRNLEDQQHSQPAIPTVANATENSLSRQKHGNPKMLLDTNQCRPGLRRSVRLSKLLTVR